MNHRYLTKLALIALIAGPLGACSFGGNDADEPLDTLFRGVNFVGVSVSNMDRSVALYNKSVDLTAVKAETVANSPALDKFAGRPGVQAETQIMKSVNAQLVLMEFAKEPGHEHEPNSMQVYGPGIAHVCYQVNSETRAYQNFLEGGASHIGDREMVQLNERNPVEYAYARDQDGTIFEVEHVDFTKIDRPDPPKHHYRIRHVSLATSDMDRLVDFYSILFQQLKPRRAGNLLAMSNEKIDRVSGETDSKIEMAWFQIRNLELELIQYHSHPVEGLAKPKAVDALGYNMIVLEVEDLAAARARFEQAGGEIVSEVESLLGGDVLFGRDPDGNLIGMQVAGAGNVISSQNFVDNGT